MSRAELTASQAETLRIWVGADPDGQWELRRGTNRDEKRIDSRVGRALLDHGLVRWVGQPDGAVQLTDEGRAWVRFDDGVAAGTEQLRHEAMATLDQHEDSPDDDTAVDTADQGEEVIHDEGADEDGESDTAPSTPPMRLFERIRIVADTLKVKAATLPGGADLRHGDEAVVVTVVEVVDIQHPGDESGVTRTPIAKPVRSYLLDLEDGEQLVDALARMRAARAAGGNTLIDPDDDPAGDLAEVIERLNRDELEVRDEDGRREWTAADEARAREVRDSIADGDWHPARQFGVEPIRHLLHAGDVEVEPEWWATGAPSGMEPEQAAEVIPHVRLVPGAAVAVDELLADAEDARPQISIRADRGGSWTVDLPDGHEAITGTWWLPDAAKQAAEQVHGALEWRQDGDSRWVADLPTPEAVA